MTDRTRYLLDERDGDLWFNGQCMCPVPVRKPLWERGPYTDPQELDAPLERGFSMDLDTWHRFAAVLPQGSFTVWFNRCPTCHQWSVGNGGSSFCDDRCRRAYLAAYARTRRAEAAKQRSPGACANCGAAMPVHRGTKRFCSDRCRQQEHRRRTRV